MSDEEADRTPGGGPIVTAWRRVFAEPVEGEEPLSASARLVAVFVAGFMREGGDKRDRAFLSVATIARRTGLGRTAVKRSLAELEEHARPVLARSYPGETFGRAHRCARFDLVRSPLRFVQARDAKRRASGSDSDHGGRDDRNASENTTGPDSDPSTGQIPTMCRVGSRPQRTVLSGRVLEDENPHTPTPTHPEYRSDPYEALTPEACRDAVRDDAPPPVELGTGSNRTHYRVAAGFLRRSLAAPDAASRARIADEAREALESV